MNTTNYIKFYNNTDLPVLVTAWISHKTLQTRVGPQEVFILYSTVGEWHLDSMFTNKEDRKLWIKAGLEKHHSIGKFRSDPCASGDYSWMDYDEPFDCIYSETSEEIKGLITLVQKPTNIQ
jgi:hypothetical protein